MRSGPAERTLTCASACLAALLLAGCGGGGGAASQPEAPAPAPPPTPAPTPSPTPSPPASGPAPSGYRLGWWNNERQYYAAARFQNSGVQDGRLHITARREALSALPDWGGQAYSSARLVTRGKASWTYGFFEIRARMPCGTGTWPALWMLGSGGIWPDDGEIDILEHVGRTPGEILGTVHTPVTGGSGNGSRRLLESACTAFHDYQLLWTADEIAIGVDGAVYHRYRNPRSGRAAWPFDAPQYLLLNLAIGGTLGGAVDDAIFPRTLEVEHVRVWQAP